MPRWLRGAGEQTQAADLCYVDAPYQDPELESVLELLGAAPPRLVVCEHHRAREIPEQIGNLTRFREARYGLTTISFLQRTAAPSDGTSVSERIAVYPGSFDPVTFGHLDILDRAAAIFDRVVVGVLENPGKTPLFTAGERVEMIRACLESTAAHRGDHFDGLTVDFAAATGAIAIVRGLRVISDFESEFQMALMNRRLNPAVNTVFLMTSFSNVFISSSLIKEVCHLGGNVDEMAPPVSVEAMQQALRGTART